MGKLEHWLFNDPLINHRLIQADMDEGKSCEKPVEAELFFVTPHKPYEPNITEEQIVETLRTIAKEENDG